MTLTILVTPESDYWNPEKPVTAITVNLPSRPNPLVTSLSRITPEYAEAWIILLTGKRIFRHSEKAQ
jgi:hypothetical protein